MYRKFEKLLTERGLKASQVSRDTRIAPSTLSEWKHGKCKPKADKLFTLAKYFDVPLEYFLED